MSLLDEILKIEKEKDKYDQEILSKYLASPERKIIIRDSADRSYAFYEREVYVSRIKEINQELASILDNISLLELYSNVEKIKESADVEDLKSLGKRELLVLAYLKKAEIIRELNKLAMIIDMLRERSDSLLLKDYLFEKELDIGRAVQELEKVDIFGITLPNGGYFECRNRKECLTLLPPWTPPGIFILNTSEMEIEELFVNEKRFFEIHGKKHLLLRDDEELLKKDIEELLKQNQANVIKVKIRYNEYEIKNGIEEVILSHIANNYKKYELK